MRSADSAELWQQNILAMRWEIETQSLTDQVNNNSNNDTNVYRMLLERLLPVQPESTF